MAGSTLNTRPVALHTFGNQTGTTIGIINSFGSTAFAGAPANPAAFQRVGIYAVLLTVAAATGVTVQDTNSVALSQTFLLPANGSIALDMMSSGDPWWQAGPGLGIKLVLGTSTTVGFDVYWLAAP